MLSILAQKDALGEFEDVPAGGLRLPKPRPGELHFVSGFRHYVVDLGIHPTFAQLQAALQEASGKEPIEERLAEVHRIMSLSDDQRRDIAREASAALQALSGSR